MKHHKQRRLILKLLEKWECIKNINDRSINKIRLQLYNIYTEQSYPILQENKLIIEDRYRWYIEMPARRIYNFMRKNNGKT